MFVLQSFAALRFFVVNCEFAITHDATQDCFASAMCAACAELFSSAAAVCAADT